MVILYDEHIAGSVKYIFRLKPCTLASHLTKSFSLDFSSLKMAAISVCACSKIAAVENCEICDYAPITHIYFVNNLKLNVCLSLKSLSDQTDFWSIDRNSKVF